MSTKTIPKLTGTEIKKIREHVFEVSQAKFALMLDVTVTSVSRWENDATEQHQYFDDKIRELAKEKCRTWKHEIEKL